MPEDVKTDETSVSTDTGSATADASTVVDAGAADVKTDTSKDTSSASTDKGTGKSSQAETGDTGKAKGNGEDKTGVWPQDWVTRFAKGDAKRAKDLSRYHSPEAVAEAYVNLRRRVDSGEFKAALPKDATEDDIKAWRKDNGIPDKADAYDLTGLEIPTQDKDIVGNFVTRLHSVNARPEVVREAVAAYYDEVNRQEEARSQKDEQDRSHVLDALNDEWGPNFRRNLTMIENTVLSRFPEDVRDMLKSARLPDGTAIFNNASAIRALVDLANEINPAGIVVPGGTGDIGKTMVEEWKSIQKVRVENRSAYNKDDSMQKRERELIDAMIKHGLMNEAGQLVDKKAA